MRSQSTLGFVKTKSCPPTEALALYAESTHGAATAATISTHLRACDFCCAETQLLARHPPRAAAPAPARLYDIPPALRRLAEELMHEPSLERARFAEGIYEIERLSLTDA